MNLVPYEDMLLYNGRALGGRDRTIYIQDRN